MRRVQNQYRSRGFTLIELIVVMIIITLVVGAIAPKFAAFTAGRKASDGARQLVALARYARTEAISEGRAYRLNVDTTKRAYWITMDKDGEYVAPPNDFGDVFAMPDGVALATDFPSQTNGGVYITLLPTGRGQPGSVTFTDQNGISTTVICPSATEMFHIAQPGEKEMTVTTVSGMGATSGGMK